MGKAILSFFCLALLAVSNVADAATYNLKLLIHNQRSSSGTRSTLVWKECTPSTNLAPCIATPRPQWNINNNVVGSDVTWTWTPSSNLDGTLTGTGQYWVTSYINSNPLGTAVISDRVVSPVIDTQARTTTFDQYACVEGTFLAGVNASGCENVDLGFNAVLDSVAEWGAGGNPYCVTLEIVDDDFSLLDGQKTPTYVQGTPNPRGGHAVNPGDPGLAPECTKTSGGFDLWTVIDSGTATPPMIATGYTAYQLLFVSNGVDVIGCTLPVDIDCQGANWITYAYAPTSSDDSVTADQGVATPVDVLANDTYLTPNVGALPVNFVAPVTLTVQTPPANGNATITGTVNAPTITYTSNPTATGNDTFVYKAVGANGDSDTGTVSVHILAAGANADSATVHINTGANTATSINVGANDSDLVDPVTITIETPPDHGGTATPPGAPGPAATAAVSFTPAVMAANTNSYDELFAYRVTDSLGATGSAVVTVHVTNAHPVAGNGNSSDIATQGLAPLGRTATFTAPGSTGSFGDTPPSTVALVTQGARGSVAQSGNLFTYTITDATFFAGSDTFTYSVTDADGEVSTGTVTVNLPQALAAPRVDDSTIFMNQNTAGSITLGITPGNGSLAQHNVAVTTQGVSGSCSISGVGTSAISVTYTPSQDFAGSDQCIVTATDGDGSTGQPGTIRMTVQAAGGGGGGGSGGPQLPGGSSAVDPWSLSLLAGAWALRRRRRGAADRG